MTTDLDTIRAMPAARNLASIESVERATGLAIELAALLERLENESPNISAKVALAHAGNFMVDVLACIGKANSVLRRDSLPPVSKA